MRAWGKFFFAVPSLIALPLTRKSNRCGLLIALTFVLAGCGGSGSSGTPPPPGPPGAPVDHSNDARLNGLYAFSFGGSLPASGHGAIAGSLQADGNGHITAGVEDMIQGPQSHHVFATISGTYNVGSEGRGGMTLNSSAGTQTFDLVILSSQHGLMVFPQGLDYGSIDRQNPTAFSLPSLAANSYAFALFGFPPLGTSSSSGFFATNASGTIVSGLEDFLPAPQTLVLSGSIGNVDANGRATAAFTTSKGTVNFALYAIDSTHLTLLETDSGTAVAGDAFSRQSSFDNSSVPAHVAFVVPFFMGAQFNTDGAGNITGGIADRFENTILVTTAVLGTYSVAANGRGTLTLTDNASNLIASYIIYPCNAGLLMLQPQTTNPNPLLPSPPLTSMAFPQQASPFSNVSISGSFGEMESGSGFRPEPFDFGTLGRLVSDGNGNISGIQDSQAQNPNATTPPPQNVSFAGTYSLAANGRGTAVIGTAKLFIYALNGSRVLFLSTNDITTGISGGVWAQ